MNKRFGFAGRSRLIAAVLTGLLVVGIVGVAVAASFAVDTFDTGALSLSVSSGPTPPTHASGSEAPLISPPLGGARKGVLDWLSGAGAANLAFNNFNTQRLNFNTDNGVAARGLVRWDGTQNNPEVNNQALSADLTGSGTNNGFDIEIVNDDLPVVMKIRVYNGSANFSERTITLPGGILAPGVHVDYVVLFGPGNNWVDTGTGASWTAATSIELEIDNSINPGADVSLDSFNVDSFRDYGDLPTSGITNPYSPAILAASHIPQGLRLGESVDVEAGPQPDVNAGTATSGDNNAVAPGFNDEEGVVPFPNFKWTVGAPPNNGGRLEVTVSGSGSGGAFLDGWIDWGNDGDFSQPGDQIINDLKIFDGSNQPINFTIPSGVLFNTSYYARFRICQSAGQCNSFTAVNVVNGEVEDYRWNFGPNAVTLNSLQAQPSTSPILPVALIGASAAAVIGVVFFVRRRKTAS